MMKVIIISLIMMVPLVGSLFGDRYFMKWYRAEPEGAAEAEDA